MIHNFPKFPFAIKTNFKFFLHFSGRVHSAMVSKLNPQSRSVTVEWYERGETKGKEVELDMLLQLNPELITNKQSFIPQPTAIPIHSQQNATNLQRVSIVFKGRGFAQWKFLWVFSCFYVHCMFDYCLSLFIFFDTVSWGEILNFFGKFFFNAKFSEFSFP